MYKDEPHLLLFFFSLSLLGDLDGTTSGQASGPT